MEQLPALQSKVSLEDYYYMGFLIL